MKNGVSLQGSKVHRYAVGIDDEGHKDCTEMRDSA